MYMCMYYVYVYVLETATTRSKHANHCGKSQAKNFSKAQDSTAVSDGTGETREDTYFAITEKYELFRHHNCVCNVLINSQKKTVMLCYVFFLSRIVILPRDGDTWHQEG